MSILAIAVKHLITAGVTGDALVTAIAEMDEAQNPKKSKGALRQKRYLERKQASQNVTNDADDVNDACDVNDASPLDGSNGFPCTPSLTSLEPPKENPPIGGQKKTPKVRILGTRLSRDWDLPDDWGEWAEKQGMSRDAIIRECDKFKDYWISKSGANATKTDWEATWRNWIRKHLEEYAA